MQKRQEKWAAYNVEQRPKFVLARSSSTHATHGRCQRLSRAGTAVVVAECTCIFARAREDYRPASRFPPLVSVLGATDIAFDLTLDR